MQTTFKVEGLSELVAALGELPKATAANVQRRVLLARAEPIAAAAKAGAAVRTGRLRNAIVATTTRPRGHKSAAARAFASTRGRGGSVAEARAASKAAGPSMVEVFVGPAGRLAEAGQTEWGNRYKGPRPYLRPAWDAKRWEALDGIAADLWAEIAKSAARLAKKRARLG